MKVGDYVEIKPDVKDNKMPRIRRDGLIVELACLPRNDGYFSSEADLKREHVLVMFSNRAFLKFHKSQIKVIYGS